MSHKGKVLFFYFAKKAVKNKSYENIDGTTGALHVATACPGEHDCVRGSRMKNFTWHEGQGGLPPDAASPFGKEELPPHVPLN